MAFVMPDLLSLPTRGRGFADSLLLDARRPILIVSPLLDGFALAVQCRLVYQIYLVY